MGAEGNPGMVNALERVPYSIAYVGISFKNAVDSDHLGTCFRIKPAISSLPTWPTSAPRLRKRRRKTPPDERMSLIFEPGPKSYPIINYEYAIVKADQPSPQQDFLSWTIDPSGGGSPKYLQAVNFARCRPRSPNSASNRSTKSTLRQEQVDKIH